MLSSSPPTSPSPATTTAPTTTTGRRRSSVPVQPRPQREIFFALDESTHSVAALMWAMESIVKSGVPKENKDNLTVVVVMSAESERLATISRIKTLLRAVYQSTTADVNLSIRAVVGFGSQVGPLICSLVDEHRPDMLVLGSAGKTHVEGFLVGSVSQYCISHANCPVVVARLTPADERGRDLRTGAKLRKRSVSPYIHV